MWKKNIEYFFIHGTKNLGFRFSTWKRSREIAKAYDSPKTLHLPKVRAKTVVIVFASLSFIAAVYVFAPSIIRLGAVLQKMQLEAKIQKTTPKSAQLPAKPKILEIDVANQNTTLPPIETKPAIVTDTVAAKKIPDTVKSALRTGMVAKDMSYCILANKGNRMLYLLSKNVSDQNWAVLKSFPILVGRNIGQKVSAGDERTPEGTYFIIGRKETEELNAIYGPLAYVLNYPNQDDRKAGRTGQGIWIHGTREDTTREATKGCVVLNNQNLITLADYLQLGIGTPVMIVNMPSISSPELIPDYNSLHAMREHIFSEYGSRQAEFASILNLWKTAWESRDIDSYSQFYDAEHFQSDGMHWNAWRDKKQKTFKAYSMISISMDKICVSEFSESTAVVLFIQEYTSDVFHMQKPKKLSFMRNNGQWKIFKEETFSRQELLL